MIELASLDINGVTAIAGILIANIGALVGFFWSLSKKQVIQDMEIKQLKKDLNNLGQKIKN